ncbi:MAG: hypothetical protein NTX72_05715 [Candidatus Uhrbacteria bacterium]|nr:hypothetical protein [Candidatus Uhrbacteria bacterium]
MPDSNNNILLQEEKQDSKLYRRTLWWVEHREQLGKIGIILLIILDACLVLFVAWSLVDAFLISSGSEQRSVVDSVALNQDDLHAYTAARAATPLAVSDVQVFGSTNNKYDFYTQLENPNADWWAEFDYQFVFDGGSTVVKQGFILPGSKKPVAELAFSSTAGIVNVQFQFQKISWHRLDHHVISDYTKWSQDRLGLEILNPTVVQDATGPFRTTFTVRNHTAYSYYNPTFYLLLKRGSAVIAVNKTTMQSLAPGEVQDVVVNWFGSVPSASQVDIIPDLNLFDPMLYKPLVGSPTIDTRSLP